MENTPREAAGEIVQVDTTYITRHLTGHLSLKLAALLLLVRAV